MPYYLIDDIENVKEIDTDRAVGHRAIMSRMPDGVLDRNSPRASADILWGINEEGSVLVHTPLSLDYPIVGEVPSLVPGEVHQVSIMMERSHKVTAHVPDELWSAGVRPQNRRVAVPDSEVEGWVKRKFFDSGFEVVDGLVVPGFVKRGNGTIPTVSFSGTVRVLDDCANDAIVKGIGRSKNYGCGLMFFNDEGEV